GGRWKVAGTLRVPWQATAHGVCLLLSAGVARPVARFYSTSMTHWTPPPGTTGLIFDCDGTLADTMPAHYKAWTAMLDRYEIPFPEPRFYAMGGMPTASIIRLLAADAGVAVTDVDAMVREKEEGFLTH